MKKLLTLLLSLVLCVPVLAQDMTAIANVAVGLSADTNLRMLLKRYDELFGTSSIIINRPGANGIIGINALLEHSGDANKLLLISSHGAILELDQERYSQLVPIANVLKQPMVLIVRKDFPANTFEEFVAYARANPGKVSHGVTSPNLTLPMIKQIEDRNKFSTNQIFYYSGRPDLDVLKGVLDSCWANSLTVIGTGLEHQVKILAVTGPKRIKTLNSNVVYSDNPKIGLQFYTHQSVWASTKMDKATQEKLNTRFNAITQSPWGQETFAKNGGTVDGVSIEQVQREWQQLRAQDVENRRKYPVPSPK